VTTEFQLKGRPFKFRQTILCKLKTTLIINLACTCACTVQLQNEEIDAQVSCAKVAYVGKVHIPPVPRVTPPLITYHDSKEQYLATSMYRYIAVQDDMICHLKPVSAPEI
jgi:hypothetical protein